MRRIALIALCLAASVPACKCGKDPEVGAIDAGVVDAGAVEAKAVELPPAPPLPPNPVILPAVQSPEANPTTPEKVQLGYFLFFDKRLSRDGTLSCAECHHADAAYTDGRPVSPKAGGAMNTRNAPTLLNLGLHEHGYERDGRDETLEAASLAQWKEQLGADPDAVAARLAQNATYKAHFQRAFHEDPSAKNVPLALAAFFRALHSGGANYDRFDKGDKTAVDAQVQKGAQVFRKANCAACHTPPLYSDTGFHNAGIGSDKPEAARDHGRAAVTHDPKDEGKFKTPSLRDVARTAPYFHDGSAATLDDAIAVMAGGGVKNPNLDKKLKPVKLSADEKAQLRAFLEALTGAMTFPAPPAALPE